MRRSFNGTNGRGCPVDVSQEGRGTAWNVRGDDDDVRSCPSSALFVGNRLWEKIVHKRRELNITRDSASAARSSPPFTSDITGKL